MTFLKNLFKPKVVKSDIIFIVEDNTAYARTLETYIKSSFPTIKEVKLFPVGETCLMELHRKPDLVIIDYFLDAKYGDAATGLDIIKEIRTKDPELNILVLSSQNEIGVVVEAIKTYKCSYVKKDELAFERVEEIIKDIYNHI